MNEDAKGRIGLNGYARLVTSTIVLSALLSGVAMQQVHATDHAPIFTWGGKVEVRPSTLNFTEGNSLRYEIRLSQQPVADGWWLRIHIDGVVYTDGILEEKGIRWVPSVGWQFDREDGKEDSEPTRWRGVTIYALQDDDTANESVTITHELSDENFECPDRLHGVARVSVGITDDDVPGIKVSPQHLTVPEGNSRSYTLKLNTQPSGTVRVSVSGLSGTDLTVDKEFPLTFTPDDWSDPQTVKVTAEDDDDAADDELVLRHRGSGGDYSGVQGELQVTIDDDDTPGATASKQTLNVPEGGSETYTVELDYRPAATVTVDLTLSPANPDLTVSPSRLTFTKSNWSAKTVTVRAAEDNDAVTDPPVTLMHDFSGGEYGDVTVPNVTVNIEENDDPGISLSTNTLEVREGHRRTYTVKLDAQPVANVEVEIQDGGDVEVNPPSLTFTPQDWNSRKTVTVEAKHDEDAAPDQPVVVMHRASGTSKYTGVTAELTVTIDEDDVPSVTVSDRSLTVREGGSNTYTVVLDKLPSESVTVTVTVPSDAELTVSPLTRTFTPQNWDMPKMFTVSAADDDMNLPDRSVTLTHEASGAEYSQVSVASVRVTVEDNDDPGIAVSVPRLTVPEGGDNTYTVRLDTQPTATTATVSVSVPSGADVTVDKPTLTFMQDTWSTPQTVRVTADHDDDLADDEVVLRHRGSGGDYNGLQGDSLEVTITDDDEPGATASKQSLSVPEGGSETYTVELDYRPAATVPVDLTLSPANPDLTVSPSRLTFTKSNWSAKTVRVRAAEDNDAVADPPVTLMHDFSGGEYDDVTVPDVTVNIVENDDPGITLSTNALEVREGSSRTYTVKLDAQPVANVEVAIQDGGDVEVNPPSLTFTPQDWNSRKTVTVEAEHDEDAATDQPVTVMHRASGSTEYVGQTADLTVTIVEDDVPSVTVSDRSLTVREGGSNTYTVVLDKLPSTSVRVTVTVPSGTELTVSPLTRTFTTQNWDTPKTFTVSAADDDMNLPDRSVTLTHEASGGEYAEVSVASVRVTVEDNDDPGIAVSVPRLTVPEGDSRTYTVKLDTQPTAATVTVSITVPSGTDVTVDKPTLTFMQDTWSVPQTVTVMAKDDDDAADDEVVLRHRGSGGDYNGLQGDSLEVTVDDDDTPGATVSKQSLSVPEGESETYTVELDFRPTGTVTVDVTADPVNPDLTVSPSRLTFTRSSWSAKTVRVSAREDNDAVTDPPVTLMHDFSGGDYGNVTVPNVTVSIVENDDPGISLSTNTLEVREGAKRTYTVKLDAQPVADVTVAIQDGGDVDVNPSSLTFTPQDWNSRQTVTVEAEHDEDTAADQPVVVMHRASGTTKYTGVTAELTVTIDEDDVPSVTVSDRSLTVREGGSNTYTVVLDKEPSTSVTVTVTVPSNTDLTVIPPSLTFTTQNWDTPKTFTVNAADDDMNLPDRSVTLTHEASGGEYAEVSVASVRVTVEDNDDPGIAVSVPRLTVPEGGDNTYTVKLDTEPTAATVTVSVSVPSGTDVTVDKPTLTFMQDTWSVPQTVTVMAKDDDDAADDEVVLRHRGSGGDYNGLQGDSLEVTVDDDDLPDATVSTRTLSVPEGGNNSYTVVLDFQPTATVTVDLTSDPVNPDLSVSPSRLTFTRTNWSNAKTVRVSAREDGDSATDPPVTLMHDFSGGDYGSVTVPDVTVTIVENDTPGVTLSTNALQIPEAQTRSYTVVLNTPPSANVTVSVGKSPSGAEVNLNPTSVDFTPTDWSSPKRVDVTAVKDPDLVPDPTVTLSHSVTGATEYSGISVGMVTVTIVETDRPPGNSPATGRPTITGTTLVGRTLTAHTTDIQDPDGLTNVQYFYQWIRVDDGAETAIPGANGSTYRLMSADAGNRLKVRVSFTDDEGFGEELTSLETDTVRRPAPPPPPPPPPGTRSQSVTFGVGSYSVQEGETVEVTVRLSLAPDSPVTIPLTASNEDGATDDDYSGVPANVVFDAGETAATFTFRAVDDNVAEGTERVILGFGTLPSGVNPGTLVTAEVSIEEDNRGVRITPLALEVMEGGSETYTVVLESEPAGAVTVTVGGAAGDLTVAPEELTFTTLNWSRAQTVTVSAAEDEDSIVDAPMTLTHTVSGGGYGGVAAPDVEVTILENDIPGVTVTPEELEVTEGSSGFYTVVLDMEPEGTVTVTVGGAVEDVTVAPEELTFTTLNWSRAQTVTVSAAEDEDSIVDAPVTLTHTVSGGGYDGVTAADVEVTIIENDIVGVTVAPEALEVREGSSEIYTVVLDTEPTGPVTVTVGGAAGDVTVAPEELTFTTLNWSRAQTVTVSAAEDEDSIVDAPVTLTHTVSGGGYGGVAAPDVEVTILENDIPGVTVTPEELEVTEGSSESYSVVLDMEPEGTVTVTVGGAVEDVTVAPEELTFTTLNWSRAQTVTVSAAEDDDAVVDAAVTLTHEVSGGGYDGVTAADVEVTVIENDFVGVTVAPEALEVLEGGSETYTVVLDAEPTGPVTVTVEGAAGDLTVSPETLSFTRSNWSTRKLVTVSAAEDEDSIVDAPVTLTHMASGGGYDGVTAAEVEVTIRENDIPGVTVTPTELSVTEGSRETYTVVLDTEPAGPVTVAVGGVTGDLMVSPASLTFTSSNWSTAQTMTVMAAEDEDALDDPPVTLTHTVSGGDYTGVTAPNVVVTILDNDIPALSIEDAEATEGDGEISFAVTMDGPSSRTVRVDWATADGTAKAGEDYTARKDELVFAPGETRQEAKVPVLDDTAVEPDETFTVKLSNPRGGSLERSEATGIIVDNDLPLVSISAASGSVDEGEDVQFDLTRSGNLRSALIVTVRVNATGSFLAETPPNTVSFGAGESAAVLRIATVDDERDEADGTVEAVLVESDDYSIQDPGKAVVVVTDNDRPPAIGIESARALEIAGEIVFPITLAGPSDHLVTVEWMTSDGTARSNEDYRGASGIVNFPPGRTTESIRVLLLDDVLLEEDETFTVTLGRAVNGTLGQSTATGVIEDDEGIVFKAWLTRFGRTVATQVVEAVSKRLTGSPYRPPQVTVGGRQLRLAVENEAGNRRHDSDLFFGSQPLMAGAGLGAPGSPGRAGESLGLYGGTLEGTQFGFRRLGGRNLLSTSSFHLTSGDGDRTGNDQGARWTAWGRGVTTQFSGWNTDLSLDGGVLTGLAGVDYTRGRILAGLAVSRSEGDGDAFAGRGQRLQSLDSELSASLTSVYPYLRVDLEERLFTWGLFGYGRGEMGATAATGSARHDIGMTMGAVGARGSLLKPEDKNGLELALKTDTFWVGMDLDANAGPRITDADASRTRLLLEAACDCRYAWAGGLVGGAVDFGIRRDAGAAETGMGLEVGANLSYLNPDRGLTVSVSARRLMAHQDDGYREWGVGGMIEYDPGAAGRGLSVRMVSSLGTAPSGTNRFWSQSAAGLNRNGYAGMDAPLTAEVDYWMRAFGGRLLMAPYADMSLVSAGSGAQSYLLGWRLQFGPNIRLQLEVDLGDRSYDPLYRNGLMGPGSMLGSPGLAPRPAGGSW